ncbi:helix-turn-helix domain-containing protein [Cellvibrio mixtus]|uniref:helix-turn-helix domain-containing protein n=1 Tax=Cellvibrio mixtus TaxID=39650 RepID=UPI000587E9DB|nr:helix-turn-helix transcriptional regulator [Cellvibrio mixtus]
MLPQKIIIPFVLLLLLSLIGAWGTARFSTLRHDLLPAAKSHFPWRATVNGGANQGPAAAIDLRESANALSVDFLLPAEATYPYAALGVTLDDDKFGAPLMDWSRYSTMVLNIKCQPANTLVFSLYTQEPGISLLPDIESFRPAQSFFNCTETGNQVHIDFAGLATPIWWLEKYQLGVASQSHHMSRVRSFAIINSFQSARNIHSDITIASATLEGHTPAPIYSALAIGIMAWVAFTVWLTLLFVKNKGKHPHHQANFIYQPVAQESKYHREKNSLLDYLASEYINPKLTLEITAIALGINRTKINQFLKEETGLTFASYLNRLRLMEAARLLTEKQMGVAEAAYAVGFGNLSHFNRTFKKEYGCSPSSYKKLEPCVNSNALT